MAKQYHQAVGAIKEKLGYASPFEVAPAARAAVAGRSPLSSAPAAGGLLDGQQAAVGRSAGAMSGGWPGLLKPGGLCTASWPVQPVPA